MFWVTAIVVLVVDQWTKSWVMAHFPLQASKSILEDFIKLTYVRNPGAAFSMFSEGSATWRDPLLILISVVVIVVILLSRKKIALGGGGLEIAYGFVVGGAVGNLIDRLRYHAVIDFIDIGIGLHRWPVFNVADSAICCGAVLLVWTGFFVSHEPHLR